MKTITMKASLAGSWYPADPNQLTAELKRCFDHAKLPTRSDIIALISPHAGYSYSGACAAQGLQVADQTYQRIVVIGPSHRHALPNQLAVPEANAFRTPLGSIPLDTKFIAKLLEAPMFVNSTPVFRGENSIEMQLPLLQHRYQNFKLVPIAAGQCDSETMKQAAAVLRELVGPSTLVVASGDFTHYGPNFDYIPFTEDVPENLQALDFGAWGKIENLDVTGFLAYLEKTQATICGRIPIAILLNMLEPLVQPMLLNYQTSGDLTGDYKNSVSYLSAAFAGRWKTAPAPAKEKPAASSDLTDADRLWLLTLARETIYFSLTEKRQPTLQELDMIVPAAAQTKRAAFVTLHQGSQLRGCIGEILPSQALYQSVMRNAINAALNDPRFSAVTAQELQGLHLEISALTPPSPVASWQDIRIGIDGMVLKKGSHSAVFLPQVAPEQGWDVETTLTFLSQKAGLSPQAWREGATFLTFQADVFGEEK